MKGSVLVRFPQKQTLTLRFEDKYIIGGWGGGGWRKQRGEWGDEEGKGPLKGALSTSYRCGQVGLNSMETPGATVDHRPQARELGCWSANSQQLLVEGCSGDITPNIYNAPCAGRAGRQSPQEKNFRVVAIGSQPGMCKQGKCQGHMGGELMAAAIDPRVLTQREGGG